MNYWLVKSEPSTWSWRDQKEHEVTMWDGVRNYQARKNMQSMKLGDLVFFYHSIKGMEIVGIVEVVKEHYIDPTDKTKKFVAVDLKYYKDLKRYISLKELKSIDYFADFPLIKQSRLSVMPVKIEYYNKIIELSNLDIE